MGDLELDAHEFFVDIPDDVDDGDDPGGRKNPSGVADLPLAFVGAVRPASAPKPDDCIAGDDRQVPHSSDHGANGPSVLSAAHRKEAPVVATTCCPSATPDDDEAATTAAVSRLLLSEPNRR